MNKQLIAVFAVVIVVVCAAIWFRGRDTISSDALAELKQRKSVQTVNSTTGKASHSKTNGETDAEVSPSGENEEVVLDEECQTLIWDLEHATFELEWKFGKIIKDAIKARDAEKLYSCFLTNASGSILNRSDRENTDGNWWRESASGHLDSSHADVNESGKIVNFLLDETKRLSKIDKVGLRILAIDPVQDETDIYRLKVLLTAKGEDENGIASLYSKHSVTVKFSSDDEIIAGKIIQRWDIKSMDFHGANEPFFREATQEYGLAKLDLPDNWNYEPGEEIDSYTSQMAVTDFDNDGFLDVVVSTIQGQQILLRNIDGQRFEDVTNAMGLPNSRFFSFTTFATWIDYDNDGFDDLLAGKNLYHNEQGRKFVRVTAESGLALSAPTMGAVVADFDCDGWLDLYVLNHLGGKGEKTFGFVADNTTAGVKNQLWRNLGNGMFEDVTEAAGVSSEARHSFSAAWFFANDDHYPDLYLVNDFGKNCLFINQGNGTFTDITDTAGVGDFANSMGVATGDLDNNGTTEIYVANMFSKMGRRIIAHVSKDDYPEGVFEGIQGACAGSHLYQLNDSNDQASPRYDEISVQKHVNEIGWAFAPVMADFDADGLLDIYAASGFISTDRKKPDG